MSDKPKTLFTAASLFRSCALYHRRLFQLDKSLKCFDEAISAEPESKRAITGKGRIKMLSTDYQGALEDAQTVLDMDKEDIHALYLKASALYNLNEYENSLVLYHRGKHIRKQPPIFDRGLMNAHEAIDRCIGREAGPVLYEELYTIHEMEQMIYKVKPKHTEDQNVTYWDNVWLERIMSKRYLGHKFALDLFFLENLINNPDVHSAHRDHSRAIFKKTKEGYQLLLREKNRLRVGSPYYTFKKREVSSEKQKIHNEMNRLNTLAAKKAEADNLLDKVYKERAGRNMKTFLDAVDDAKTFLDEVPIKLLPKKKAYLETLYNTCALKYMDGLRLVPGIDTERQIKLYFGLPVEEQLQSDAIITDTIFPFMNYRKMLKQCQDRLRMSSTDLERAWLHYEITRAQMALGPMLMAARNSAKKCLLYGKSAGSKPWRLLANTMLMRVEAKSKKRKDARNATQDAEDLARDMQEKEIENFIGNCYLVIDRACLTKGNADPIGEREDKILSLMADPKLRFEIQELFVHMNNQPLRAQMSIIPGVKPKTRKKTSAVTKVSDQDTSDHHVTFKE